MPFRPKRPVRPIAHCRRRCKDRSVGSLTNAVDIGLNVRFVCAIHQRKIIVDHHVNLENVNSSSNDIGGNQNLGYDGCSLDDKKIDNENNLLSLDLHGNDR
jgi:hypothetical protein